MRSGASVLAISSAPLHGRVGVFGGTFNPIHVGHLASASEVFYQLQLDHLLFVPTYRQPFKGVAEISGEQRLIMCALAVESDARFSVSDVDIARDRTTYTVETLTDLRALHPDVADWFFIAGSDALARFDEWRNPEQIRELATIVGITRDGDASGLSRTLGPVVEVPALRVSSTDVRKRLQTGRPIDYLVNEPVADYIYRNDLYSGGPHD